MDSVKRALLVGILFALALGAIAVPVVFMVHRGGSTPPADQFVFERDVLTDHGDALDMNEITSADEFHVRLVDVLNQENIGRYGHDQTPPNGGSLKVTFRVKRGMTTLPETTFVIPEQERRSNNEKRRQFVEEKRQKFVELAEKFAASIDVNFAFAVVVDTTEGINPELEGTILSMTRRAVGDLADGKSTVYAYQLHELSYQGSRQAITPKSPTDLTNALDSFLAAKGVAGQSSVLRGIQNVLTDINSTRKGEPIRVDVWTDGLENTESHSVYSMPLLLDPAGDGWEKLDGVWSPTSLDLTGLEIHLHPLPPKSQRHEDMTIMGLDYLADRLRAAGAQVTVEVI